MRNVTSDAGWEWKIRVVCNHLIMSVAEVSIPSLLPCFGNLVDAFLKAESQFQTRTNSFSEESDLFFKSSPRQNGRTTVRFFFAATQTVFLGGCM